MPEETDAVKREAAEATADESPATKEATQTTADAPAQHDGEASAQPAGEKTQEQEGSPQLDEAKAKMKQGLSSAKTSLSALKGHGEKLRELQEAQKALETMRSELQSLEAEHTRRVQIEENFDAIMEEQEAARRDAVDRQTVLKAHYEEVKAKAEPYERELAKLVEQHRNVLEPHENVLQGAKGQLESAVQNKNTAVAANSVQKDRLSKAQRELESIARSIADVNKQSQDTTSKANSMRKSEGGLDEMSYMNAMQNINASLQMLMTQQSQKQMEMSMIQQEIVRTAADIDRATSEVNRCQGEVNRAQASYDRVKKSCDEEEAPTLAILRPLRQDMQQTSDMFDACRSVELKAQAAMDDARDVHDHPELTKRYADDITVKKAEIDEQNELVERLSEEEAEAKQAAQKGKLIVGIAAAVVILILILVFVFVL